VVLNGDDDVGTLGYWVLRRFVEVQLALTLQKFAGGFLSVIFCRLVMWSGIGCWRRTSVLADGRWDEQNHKWIKRAVQGNYDPIKLQFHVER
jgi:hypothetical protein